MDVLSFGSGSMGHVSGWGIGLMNNDEYIKMKKRGWEWVRVHIEKREWWIDECGKDRNKIEIQYKSRGSVFVQHSEIKKFLNGIPTLFALRFAPYKLWIYFHIISF